MFELSPLLFENLLYCVKCFAAAMLAIYLALEMKVQISPYRRACKPLKRTVIFLFSKTGSQIEERIAHLFRTSPV